MPREFHRAFRRAEIARRDASGRALVVRRDVFAMKTPRGTQQSHFRKDRLKFLGAILRQRQRDDIRMTLTIMTSPSDFIYVRVPEDIFFTRKPVSVQEATSVLITFAITLFVE